ncbi:MAG: ABC transporter permease [Planctomycetes bacterium]|nr:ABC transporter permease [Planctomycetota bacterium]
MLPFDYAARNCLRSPARLVQLIIGSMLVVLLVCFAAAFGEGMTRGLAMSGDEKNVIILGSGSEESVERSEVAVSSEGIIAASISGIAEYMGESAVSGEIYYNGLITISEKKTVQAILRGVNEQALDVHQNVRLVAGTWPRANEIMVGVRCHQALGLQPEELAIGQSLMFEDQHYRISGHFIAPGSVLEAEIWMDREDLMAATQRDSLSCVVIRLGEAELADIEYFVSTRLDLELVAISEVDYYRQLAAFYQPISFMAWITALLIAAGAMLGGINTLYAAFAARQRELATLQAIGYSRTAVFISLLQESLMTVMLGACIALALGIWVIDGLQISFASGVFSLHWDVEILVLGVITASILGIFGTVPPAWRCLAPSLTSSLRGLA